MNRSSFALSRALCTTTAALLALTFSAEATAGDAVVGRITAPDGSPIVGAMVSFGSAPPVHRVTVYSDADGRYATPALPFDAVDLMRVRRIGWQDRLIAQPYVTGSEVDVTLERETDAAVVAAQLPANHWLARLLPLIEDEGEREEFVRQCGFCHQQGAHYTRALRDPVEWKKILSLMGRKGAMLSSSLREKLPELFNRAYDPETAVPELTANMSSPDFAPPPAPDVRQAVVEEWDLGGPGSMQHDVMVHPDGRIYGVDMPFDKLHRLDPATSERRSWQIPDDGVPLGGAFADRAKIADASTNSHVGPHSLQAAPNGDVWITLASGNRLARFDPQTEEFEIHQLDAGLYPHTLRFDARGRVWFTLTASNHVGMFDPETGESAEVRLPSRTWTQAFIVRAMPFLMWMSNRFDLRGEVADGEPVVMPVPYGIDVAPDGTIWFSQLNEHRIGRVDPDSFDVEVIDTPFPAPRRLRFDSKGKLWIPSFSGSRIARFDPASGVFDEWALPTEPHGSETPYALHVDRRSDTIWICGTASDSMIRFEPTSERWSIYPLPTRVTFTREVDFDRDGRIWTSNSNSPAWQIEDGVPRVLRIDPRPRRAVATATGSESTGSRR